MIKYIFACSEGIGHLILVLTGNYFVRKSIDDFVENGFNYYALSIFLLSIAIAFSSALRVLYLAEKVKRWRE